MLQTSLIYPNSWNIISVSGANIEDRPSNHTEGFRRDGTSVAAVDGFASPKKKVASKRRRYFESVLCSKMYHK